MRYWSVSYPDENGNDITETLSEEDIRKEYWLYWYGKMCEKFGKEFVDKTYSFEDCLEDWIIVNWAVESK